MPAEAPVTRAAPLEVDVFVIKYVDVIANERLLSAKILSETQAHAAASHTGKSENSPRNGQRISWLVRFSLLAVADPEDQFKHERSAERETLHSIDQTSMPRFSSEELNEQLRRAISHCCVLGE